MSRAADPTSDAYPAEVSNYAAQAVDYVMRAVGLELEFDSDTLPLLDHYLRTVPRTEVSLVELVAVTSGAYFGEVVRRRLGGRWDLTAGVPDRWRLILVTGLSFSPVAIVAEALAEGEVEGFDASFDAPAKLRPHLEAAMQRMSDVTVEEYYSLCGRLDTLEHLQEVLLAVAAQLAVKQRELGH